ncbi:MAG TPA: hypothetical protein VNZ57_12015 [Longimicrobiales bacterium]|nr:hypothetical protein [Longimicrobiales bacterium]
MSDNEKTQRGGGLVSWFLMVLAVVLTAGFMGWLAVTAEPTSVAVVETEAEDTPPPVAARTISLADLGSAGDYVGQQVQIAELPVMIQVAPQIFWTLLPTSHLYLVRVTPELAQQGIGRSSQVLTVTGTVRVLDADVIAGWREAGVITTDAQAQDVAVASTYLDVTVAQEASTAGAPATPAGN